MYHDLAGWEYSAARRRNTSFGICPRQEPLGQVGQKPLDSYRKRFGTKILLTWKSFNQPHVGGSYLVLILILAPWPAKLVLLSLLLLQLRLITHSCTYAKTDQQ